MKVIRTLILSSIVFSWLNAADPCELLSIDDIKAIFPDGDITITTHDKEPTKPLGIKRCFWDASESDMKFVQLSIIEDEETHIKVADQFANNKQFVENPQMIDGIGDASYYGGSGLKIGAVLHVLLEKEGVLLTVMVGLGRGNKDELKHIEIEKELASKILTKIQKEQ